MDFFYWIGNGLGPGTGMRLNTDTCTASSLGQACIQEGNEAGKFGTTD